jgi:hypothetical protein
VLAGGPKGKKELTTEETWSAAKRSVMEEGMEGGNVDGLNTVDFSFNAFRRFSRDMLKALLFVGGVLL